MANARTIALRSLKSIDTKYVIKRIESCDYQTGGHHLNFDNDWLWLKAVILALRRQEEKEKEAKNDSNG